MKIVFLDHSAEPGGGQLGLARYFDHTSANNRILVCLGEGFLTDHARKAGIETHVVQPQGRGKMALIAATRRALKLVGQINPDVVVTNSLTMANIVGLVRRPRLSSSGPLFLAYLREDLSLRSIGYPKRPFMMRGSLQRFHGFIANSHWTASTIPAALKRKPRAVAYPISGVMHVNDWGKLGEQPGRLRLLSLSRIVEWKGIHVLLSALEELSRRGRNAELEVVIAGDALFGDEAYYQGILRRCAALSMAVETPGKVMDIGPLLQQGHVLLHCSIRPEPFGQVIPQALANGLVPVASVGGGPSELLTEGVDGLLVQPDNPTALADAIETILDSPEFRQSLVRAGQNTALNLTDDELVTELESTLDYLVEAIRS